MVIGEAKTQSKVRLMPRFCFFQHNKLLVTDRPKKGLDISAIQASLPSTGQPSKDPLSPLQLHLKLGKVLTPRRVDLGPLVKVSWKPCNISFYHCKVRTFHRRWANLYLLKKIPHSTWGISPYDWEPLYNYHRKNMSFIRITRKKIERNINLEVQNDEVWRNYKWILSATAKPLKSKHVSEEGHLRKFCWFTKIWVSMSHGNKIISQLLCFQCLAQGLTRGWRVEGGRLSKALCMV